MRKATVIVNFGTYLTHPGRVLSLLNIHGNIFRYLLVAVSVGVVLFVCTSYHQNPTQREAMAPVYFSPAIVDSLSSMINEIDPDSQVIIHGERTVMLKSVREFYSRHGNKPVWAYSNNLNAQATGFLYLIEHAREYGLEPRHYHFSAIRELQQEMETESRKGNITSIIVDLEVLMTDAAFRLMVNLHAGYTSFDSTLYSSDWVADLPDILLQGIITGEVVEQILSVEPRFIEYTRLRRASEHFVRTNLLTDDSVVINYPSKDSVILYSQIREALKQLGYLKGKSNRNDITMILREFQHFHGLTPDGKPGKNTVEALKQSTLYKYRILALNLDRLRKKGDMDANLLYVNIPAYQLKIFNGNMLKDTFRIIVGHPSSPTPVLSSRMDRIIANPVWYVPKSITMQEILPKIKADSGYLKRNRFKVLDSNHNLVNISSLNLENLAENDFDYTLRQDRGSDNSLGQVKFVFPNPYAVYLHDTPGKTLFSKDIRAFSHGCVRVQHPERLADYILHEINADSTNINQLISTGRHREFTISASLSIQILYITCEGDNAGELYFYKDIYEFDKKELEQLASLMEI